MDCQQAKDLLSAYHDRELSSEGAAEVAQHLAACDECAVELAAFSKLSAMARNLIDPVPPHDIWDCLEPQLHAVRDANATAGPSRGRRHWMMRPAVSIAFAAAALAMIAVGWLGYTMSRHHDEHEMTAVFGSYLDEFQVDPYAAQHILLANYPSRAVTKDQAIYSVGYHPAAVDELPPGYSLVSTHVMKMPCCTCVQCLCQRDDGTAIAIFEHDDEEPNWYGDRASRNELCGGAHCSLVQLNSHLAATWQRGKRHISVIGARDTAEISQFVAWFDERRKGRTN